MEKEDDTQQLGKPKYKVGEEVCFVYGKDRDQEAKGRICIIDAYGTWEQQEEVVLCQDLVQVKMRFSPF